MLLVKVARWSIFLGGQEPADKPLAAALSGALGEMGEERGFDGSADDATAQQKSIYLALLAFIVRDCDSDQAVVAEAIAHPNRKNVAVGLLSHFSNLRLGVAASGQIELVGFLCQLRDSRQRQVGYRLQFGFLFEVAKEIFL
jgi:hypothetical protein